jgi:iron complex outermembrane recepter protein
MKSILSAVIGATLALCVIESDAQTAVSERSVDFVIESKTLAGALDKWAQLTGIQLFSPDWDIAENLEAPRLDGTFTPQTALEALLRGTPLTYAWIDSRTVAIRRMRLPASSMAPRHGAHAADAKRLELETAGLMEFTEIASSPQRVPSNEGSGDYPKAVDDLEEVIVTGTHIRGAANTTAPMIVMDRAQIESTGLSSTSALVESLPQNFALANHSGVLVPGVSGPRTQGSSINLRGVGEGTTLVLLNGRRMAPGFFGSAVDISALPLSAIERVEVLTDGASAIYGSDAIGGVVNFILRRDFEGAETRVRTGWADGGVNEYRMSQTFGDAWTSGNALLSAEYLKRDLLPASARDFVPSSSEIGSLSPQDKNYALTFSGRQQLSNRIGVFADALYSSRDTYNEGGRVTLNENFRTDNPQLVATAGLDAQLGRNWLIEGSGSYARDKLDQRQHDDSVVEFGLGELLAKTEYEIRSAQVKADGPLFNLSGGPVRLAIGADWRSESMQVSTAFTLAGPLQDLDLNQTVRSVFAEVQAPFVSEANALRGIRRLEVSLAGRFDDYSNFGSSFDPRVGIMWEPVKGFRLRGTYGTSYKAPALLDYNVADNVAAAFTNGDPGSPPGQSYQMFVSGTDPETFRAQESESLSIGAEIVPAPNWQLSINYYKINYHDRIAQVTASPASMLANPAAFAGLVIRDPSVAQVNHFIEVANLGQGFIPFDPDFNPDPNFTPDSVDVILDFRKRNLSAVETRGLDVSTSYELEVGDGTLALGVAGTYILELRQKTTPSSASFDNYDTFATPPDWRVRGSLGWQRRSWSVNLFLNHTDSYVDNRTVPVSPISSYTTVDAHVAYDFTETFKTGFLSGLVVSASVQNLLDQDPPRTAVISIDSDMGFDPTNANPMGRFVAIELQKSW